MTDYKQYMISRAEKRKEKFLSQYEKVIRAISLNRIGGEYNRLWMDKQVEGLNRGLDICCGDMVIGEAEGVDGDYKGIGPVWYTSGDELTNHSGEEFDFIATNYIEAFPNILKVLNEWHRVLKPSGLLVFACADANQYSDSLGPLVNSHRLSIFTEKIIKQYLSRAGFINIAVIQGEEKSLLTRANKP